MTLSRTVAKLTSEGLLERTVSDADSRVQNLTLSRAGTRRFLKAREAFDQWSGEVLGAVAPSELKELKRVLGKIRTRLGQVTGEERGQSEFFAPDARA